MLCRCGIRLGCYNFNAYTVSSPNNGLITNALQGHVLTVRIRPLHFGYLINLFQRRHQRHHMPGPAAARRNAHRLFEVLSNRWRLKGELKHMVFESHYRDGH